MERMKYPSLDEINIILLNDKEFMRILRENLKLLNEMKKYVHERNL